MTENPQPPENPQTPESSEAIGELAAALAAAQAELPSVAKTKTATVRTRDGGSYSYSYADLGDVAAATYAVMARHGLAFATWPTYDESGRFVLVGALMHASGAQLTGVFPLPAEASGPQILGSALTYGRRYLLGCLTGVVAEDDDDAQAAVQRQGDPGGTGSKRAKSTRGRPPESPLINQDAPASRAMHDLLRRLFGTDREAVMDFCSQVVDRLIASTSDLTDLDRDQKIIPAARAALEEQARERADHEGESAAGEVAGDA